MLRPPPLTIGTSWLNFPDPHANPDSSPLALAKDILASEYSLVDTSNEYMQGGSETTLGLAMAEADTALEQHVVTKADADPVTRRFDRDRVWRSFEESTTRLGMESFPIYHLHDPYSVTFEEAVAPNGVLQGLIELRDQGLVGGIGIAAGPLSLLRDYMETDCFDAVLTHNRYTLVDRRADTLLDVATAKGMTVFNAAPFGGGFLAGKESSYAYREVAPPLSAWLDRAKTLCASHDVSLAAAALQFSIRDPRIHSTVVGVSKRHRLAELPALQKAVIPGPFWDELALLGRPSSPLID